MSGAAQIQAVWAAGQQSVHFLDVGQGDSILLEDGNGYEVLIDGGKRSSGETVLQALAERQITDLETMLVTHADADHVGGLIAVLASDEITVGEVLYNGYPGDTQTWDDFSSAVSGDGLTLKPVQYPAELAWGEMRAYVLNPPAGLVSPETNPASLVVRVDYRSMRYLLTGDIDTAVEVEVIARQTPVASQVLKVGHHGSAYSSSPEFLESVQPAEAVISVGNNSYGHPASDTLDRLAATGADLWRTDLNGADVDVTTDGLTHYWIEGQRNELGGNALEKKVYLAVVSR